MFEPMRWLAHISAHVRFLFSLVPGQIHFARDDCCFNGYSSWSFFLVLRSTLPLEFSRFRVGQRNFKGIAFCKLEKVFAVK